MIIVNCNRYSLGWHNARNVKENLRLTEYKNTILCVEMDEVQIEESLTLVNSAVRIFKLRYHQCLNHLNTPNNQLKKIAKCSLREFQIKNSNSNRHQNGGSSINNFSSPCRRIVNFLINKTTQQGRQ